MSVTATSSSLPDAPIYRDVFSRVSEAGVSRRRIPVDRSYALSCVSWRRKIFFPDDILATILSFGLSRSTAAAFRGVSRQWQRVHDAAMGPLWTETLANPVLKKRVWLEESSTDTVPGGNALSSSLERLGRLHWDFQQGKCWEGLRVVQGNRLQRSTAPEHAIAMATFLTDKNTPFRTIHAQVYRTCLGGLPSRDLTKAEIQKWFKDHESDLAKIKELDLSGLGLTEVPWEFCEVPLPNLQSISLARNQLQHLPPGFGNEEWPKLKHLDLSENQYLSTVGGALERRQLEQLSLRNNELFGLPWAFGKEWPGLTALDLTGNNLQRRPNTTFWPNMRELKMDPEVVPYDNPAWHQTWHRKRLS
jgi:hypothetical protein